jgi:hypothetical protein
MLTDTFLVFINNALECRKNGIMHLFFHCMEDFFLIQEKVYIFSGVGNMQTSNAAKFKDGSFCR